MYYGTVARYPVKPGHEDQFLAVTKSFEESPPAGWLYTRCSRAWTTPMTCG